MSRILQTAQHDIVLIITQISNVMACCNFILDFSFENHRRNYNGWILCIQNAGP